MSFLDLSSELVGVLPGLSPFLADRHINRAWVDICNARPWSWLQADGAIFCPAQITSGTVAIVQGSATVTCDATASAALAVQQATALPTLTNLQIRFGPSSPSAGQVYNIIVYDVTVPAAAVLTLDRVVVEPTDTDSTYQCYRCYVVAPSPGGGRAFLSWASVTDVTNGWTLKRDYTSAYLDQRDPQRQAQGLGYYLADYQNTRIDNVMTGTTTPNPNQSAGVPNYEIWPHPTAGQKFYCRMKLKGQAFVQPTDEIPTNIIDEQMILQRALSRYTYPWALANQGHFPALRLSAAAYGQLISDTYKLYNELLVTAKRQDGEQAEQMVWNRGHGLRTGGGGGFKGIGDFPIDSNYMQSHLIRL